MKVEINKQNTSIPQEIGQKFGDIISYIQNSLINEDEVVTKIFINRRFIDEDEEIALYDEVLPEESTLNVETKNQDILLYESVESCKTELMRIEVHLDKLILALYSQEKEEIATLLVDLSEHLDLFFQLYIHTYDSLFMLTPNHKDFSAEQLIQQKNDLSGILKDMIDAAQQSDFIEIADIIDERFKNFIDDIRTTIAKFNLNPS